MRKSSRTAAVVLLIATLSAPVNWMLGSMLMLRSPPNSPARPAGVRSSLPVPFVTSTSGFAGSPSDSEPSVNAKRTTRWPLLRVSCSKTKLPLSFCSSTIRYTSRPSTRTYGPAGRFSVRVSVSDNSNTAFTMAALVVLIAISKSPPRLTPGMFTPTVPPMRPANPSCLRSRTALPFVSVRKSVVPSPRPTFTFEAMTRTTFVGVVPVVVLCSKAKLPLKRWPATRRFSPMPSSRRYGPAGRLRATVWLPTENCSPTATAELLKARLTVPLTSMPSDGATSKCPLTRPARPAGLMTKNPSPSVRLTIFVPPASRWNSRSVMAMRTSFCGAPGDCGLAGAVYCSNAKRPRSVWPKTVISIGGFGAAPPSTLR